MAQKEILSRLFNLVILKILDLYLEMWLWSSLICAEKIPDGGVDILDYMKRYIFGIYGFFSDFLLLFSNYHYCYFMYY